MEEISKGQDSGVWSDWWSGITPDSEIRMWDFYGGRQWISKFVPRHGKTIEAGCGMGRYNLYFSRMGMDVEGIDFSEPTVKFLNQWKNQEGFEDSRFIVGDILNLPYEENSLSGYISLGVVEHFIEGPQEAIREAARVLRPGGVAIITTPSISWNVFLRNLKIATKRTAKKLLFMPKAKKEPFFQYEYRPNKLKSYVQESGLHVTAAEGADLLYTFHERGGFSGDNIHEGSFAYNFSQRYEKTFLKSMGAQAITISVKKAPVMHCFLCGELEAKEACLNKYVVPVCHTCESNNKQHRYYLKSTPTNFNHPYQINPEVMKVQERTCDYSGQKYKTDPIFENYGFTKNVSPESLKKPEVNIELCNEHIQPIWRKRL